ncbi:MAG: hypothetical protein Q7J45_01635 [bacterium]|nr:hypothetical protein [bacterium]
MLRLLLTSIISLSLGMSAVGAFVPMVHAQSTSGPAPTPAAPAAVQAPGVGDSVLNEAAKSRAAKAAGINGGNPDEGKPMAYETGPIDKAFMFVMTAIMTLAAWLLGIAMVMLDNAVLYTVVNMGSYIKGLSAIGVTWEILRNIGNIALIFGFLAIGIATILNANWYGGKQMIPRLIMGAILLNFSLFMTEAVIDVGNFLATNIYTQINGGVAAGEKLSAVAPAAADAGIVGRTTAAVVSTASSINNEAITSKIMNQLGLQRIYGDALKGNKELLATNNVPLVAALGILLFIILAFVMFFLSFVLIARFIYLIYAIIIAPVGVVGFVIPQFEGVGKDWMKNLLTQSMTAPVMFLLLYVALRIITDASFLGFGAPPDYMGFIQDAKGNYNLSGFANILISFFVAIGALLGVIYGTNKFGAFGGKWASKTAGKLSFGLTAATLRSTAGWGMQAGSKAIRQSRLRSTNFGRMTATALDRGATGNWDVRSSTSGSSALKTFGIEAGDAQKGGYRGRVNENVKAYESYAKTIEGRPKTKLDEKQLEGIAQAVKDANKEHEIVKEAHKKAVVEHTANQAEVDRLEKEVKQNATSTIVSPERDRRDQETKQSLESARANLETSGVNINSLQQTLTSRENLLKEKKEIEEKTKGEINARTGEQDAKNARKVYGENLQKKGFLGLKKLGTLAMFGSGASEASKKIIKEATKKKTKKEEAIEVLEKSFKETFEEDLTKKGEVKEEKSKEGEESKEKKPS